MALDKNEILLQLGVTMLTVAASTAVTIYVTQSILNKRKEDDDEAIPNPPPFMLPDAQDDKLDALGKQIEKLASNPVSGATPNPGDNARIATEEIREEMRRNRGAISDLREAMFRRGDERSSH